MDADWRSTLSNQERSKYITELAQILAQISQVNGGDRGNFNLEKLKKTAEQFEKNLYASSSSKDLYLDSMRKRIAAMDTARKKAIANVQQNSSNAQSRHDVSTMTNQQMQQQMQMQQRQQQQQQQQAPPSHYPPGSNNVNSQMFFNQQAKLRQQAAQQLRGGIPRNAPVSNNAARPQLTPQQQQLINEMKGAEIPRELLQRIPNLPPGVNTWQKVTELAQQKRLGPKDLQIAKQVYQMHQQIVFKSRLQQVNANNRGPPQGRPNSRVPSAGPGSQAHQGQSALQQPQQPQPHQPQPQMQQPQIVQQSQPQQMPMGQPTQAQTQEVPNVLNRLNQIFTPAEQKALYENGKKLIADLQRTNRLPAVLTPQQQAIYIKKYINQMALKKLQAARNQMGTANASSQQATVPPVSGTGVPQMSQFMPNSGGSQANLAARRPYSGANSNINAFNENPTASELQGPPQNMEQTVLSQPQPQGQVPTQSQTGSQVPGQSQPPPKFSLPRPTEQDLMVLRRISAEIQKSHLRLSNITNQISQEQKQSIRNKLQLNRQLFTNVDSFIPTLYMITRNEENVRQLLQIRMLTKEITEHASRGIFIVPPEVVDKVIFRYQKYYEFIKDQVLRRHQQIIAARQQQQQQQQQQTQPTQQTQHAPQTQQVQQVQQQQTHPRTASQQVDPTFNQQRIQGSFQQIQQQMQMRQHQQHQQQKAQQFTSQIDNWPRPASAKTAEGDPGLMPHSAPETLRATTSGVDFLNSPELLNAKLSPQQGGLSPAKKQAQMRKKMTLKQASNQGTPSAVMPSSTPAPGTGMGPVVSSRTGTPRVANVGLASVSPMATKAVTANQSPSPKSIPNNVGPSGPVSNQYKEDEEILKKMVVRKNDVISRFKRRQDILRNSAVDLFLCCLGESLGVSDDQVELINSIPQEVVDQVNGAGKKVANKPAAQRLKDQEYANVSIKDNRIVFATNSPVGNYKPDATSFGNREVSSIFRDVYGTTDLTTFSFGNSNLTSGSRGTKRNAPDSENSPNISPASSAVMSDSKKIKFDSPEDLYFSAPAEEVKKEFTKDALAGNAEDSKIWDWSFWDTS
ncbi:LADA_0F07162g1_1 [Lachancea dasiensis]|uniref:Mediator of RNA polymerase II transcription subunit 15 n=1 Tax=Lachancea dasiensis TaxID=1072105 RepID=A0A1G4JK91_9SACH|nr:LADA_0F07162g1_1 [Lachancea dasiensis]